VAAGKRVYGASEKMERIIQVGGLMKNEVRKIEFSKDPAYFLHLADDWNVEKFPALWAIGNPDLLKGQCLALFCSSRCPGNVILKSYDFAVELREHAIPVIGGFQTSIEKECLNILSKGKNPIVVYPARSIQSLRVPVEWSKPIEDGRLLLVSPFRARYRRATMKSAELRNRFVAAAADKIFFLHAALKSRTLALAEELIQAGRNVFTFDLKENENLKNIGARCDFLTSL
jgi:predicted Rossmann fold nucleotide-binding protein DprA/Smf involved in DNA uptake